MIAEAPYTAESPTETRTGTTGPGVTRRRFSSAEYHAMARAGILDEGERIELIQGAIIRMTPIGSHHAACVRRLNKLFSRSVGDQAVLAVQDPIRLDDSSEPQPDLALLRPRADLYAEAHPSPADILLLVEVADTSLDYDRNVKLPLYAKSSVPETWLVRLQDACLEVHRHPGPTGYQEMHTLKAGETIACLAFPDLRLEVGAILG